MNIFLIISLILTLFYVLFLPGFLLSLVFFGKGKIDSIERIAFSFALSIAIVPLVVLYMNLIGIKITKISVISDLSIIMFISLVILLVKFVKENLPRIRGSYIYEKANFEITKLDKRHISIIRLNIVLQELFQITLFTYLILLIAETVKEGFVSYFFNLNYLLIIVLASGASMIITSHEKNREKINKQIKEWDWYYILGISLGGGILVYSKTQGLGTISVLMAIVTGIIIFLLSILLFVDKQ